MATDVRQLTPLKEQILFNTEVIAVNKDPLGRPGDYVYTDEASSGEVWSRDMWDATKVVVCFNPHGTKVYSICRSTGKAYVHFRMQPSL